ncbi:MAG: hypothetical protein WEA58_00905, partial [Balneolaceae bacterium]
MMKNVTIMTHHWLRPGIVILLSGLIYLLPANMLSAMGTPGELTSYQVEPETQLSELYVSQRNSDTPKVSLKVENEPLIDVLHQLADELNVSISINTS